MKKISNENHDERLRANQPESGNDRRQSYQSKVQQDTNPNKMDSVMAEMRNSSSGNEVQRKTGIRNVGRKNVVERDENF